MRPRGRHSLASRLPIPQPACARRSALPPGGNVPNANRGTCAGGRDPQKAKGWIEDPHEAEKTGDLPAFMIMSLGDDAPEDELDRILWLAVKGPDEPYPVRVRRAVFVERAE